MTGDTKSVLQANLDVLWTPTETAQLLADHEPRDCRLEVLPNGQPQLYFRDQPVYGGEQPVDQAAREARSLLAGKEPDVVVFFGFGLGLHVDFMRRLTAVPIVIFEPNLDVAAFSLAHVSIDLPDIHLAVDRSGLEALLNKLLRPKKLDVVAGALPWSRQSSPEDLAVFQEVIEASIQVVAVNSATRERFSIEWVANLAANLPALGRLKSYSPFSGQFTGKPAIIIGAGPSLDLNLEALSRVQGRALLVAVHTAVIPLANAGIVPDMVIIVEAQKLDHFFSGVPHLDRMVLVPSPQTHPIHLTLGFKTCLGVNLLGNTASQWLENAYGDKPLQTGGSVACTALALAADLGCDPLIMVGMDLAYSLGRSHALGTDLGCCDAITDVAAGITSTRCREGYHWDVEFPTIMVPAWGGQGDVAARSAFSSFRIWFEDAARNWLAGRRLVNANGAGSRIGGFEEITLDEALERYCAETVPWSDLIDRILATAPERDPAPLADQVRQELEYINKAGATARKAGSVAAKASARLKKGQLNKVQPLLDSLSEHEAELKDWTSRTRLLNTLVGHRALDMVADKITGDKVARTIASLEKSRELNRLVSDGAAELKALLEPALAALPTGESLEGKLWSARRPVAIVGTGNFAANLEALVSSFGMEVRCFVDEHRKGTFLDRPVYRAARLDQATLDGVDKWLVAISDPEHRQAAVASLEGRGLSPRKILILDDDPDLPILRLMFEKFGLAASTRFGATGVQGIGQLENKFLGADLQAAMASLDPARATIGLGYFGRGGGFRRHISGLIPLLEERFNVVSMSDEIMGEAEQADRHVFLSPGRACKLEGLDLVLSAHVLPCAPPEVPRVSFSHLICDFNLTAECHAQRIGYSHTHYLFASSRNCFDWCVDLVERFGLKNRICVIPGGDLQLDRSLAELAAVADPPRSILYAPTLSLADYPHRDLVTSLDQGPDILAGLLEAFNDREVIFRPHPGDLKLHELGRDDPRSATLTRMLDLCRSHPRCRLDDNPISYLDSFQRAAVLVSDSSSAAFTFALATGRPVVFFSPREVELAAELGPTLPFVGDREQVGRVVAELPELVPTVEHLLQNEGQDSRQAAQFRDRMIFNLGSSARYFVDNIDFILNDERHPDWHYLNW